MAPYPGIQTDEAIFSSAVYPPGPAWFEISIFKKKVGIMVMSYLGGLKGWLLAPVFAMFRPSAYSIRLPAVIVGSLTVWAFYRLGSRAFTPGIGLFGAVLLATDPSFLLSTTFDWGPVALQHFFLVVGCVLVLGFAQTGSRKALGWGFGCFGLGMWDKALFVWGLSGLGVASLVVYPRQLWGALTWRNVRVAVGCFCLGALPLIIYNVRRPLETFRSNTSFSTEAFEHKIRLLPKTLGGSVFFGYFVEEDWAAKPRLPQSRVEEMSLRLSEVAGRRDGWMPYAFFVALGLVVVLIGVRLWKPGLAPPWKGAVFCLVFGMVAWAQMVFTRQAGGGAHHTILLWPFPLLLIALTFGWVAGRLGRAGNWVLGAVAVLLVVPNLLVLNQYHAQMVRNGSGGAWSDAIYGLSDKLMELKAGRVYLTDWGMLDNLRLLSKGKLPLWVGSGALMKGEPDEADRKDAAYMLETPDAVFVSFVDGREVFPEVNRRMRRLASEAGYERELVGRIADRNGRDVFEVARYRKGK